MTTVTTQRIKDLLVLWMVLIIIVLNLFLVPMALGDENGGSLTLVKAVTYAIANTPEVTFSRETVTYKKAQVQIDKGEQDVEISAGVSYDRDDEPLSTYYQDHYKKTAEDKKTLTTTLSAEKELNSGITLTSSLSLERVDDDLASLSPENTASVSFEVSLPLMELWSTGLYGKEEKNSEIDLRASIRDLAATISQSAESVAIAFWDAYAAKKILEECREEEAEGRKFARGMKILVEKNEYAAANLDRVKADVDSKAVASITAEQNYYAARQQLALEMGADIETLTHLPDVEQAFPSIERIDPDIKAMLKYSEEHRHDLAAEKIRATYYEEVVRDAEDDMLADVDLSLTAGYNGLDETSRGSGYFRSLSQNTAGPSYSVDLSYSRPFGNNVAKGNYGQARITLNKKRVEINQLRRNINSDVLTAYQQYRNSISALEQQLNATEKYKSALDKELMRFKLNMSTLSDLMDTRDDYHKSMKILIAMQKSYSESVVKLKWACGSLVQQKGNRFEVDSSMLISPFIGFN